MIRWDTSYIALMASLRRPPGRFVRPEFAEWLHGFPCGWTGDEALPASQPRPHGQSIKAASLFAGIAGLDLGVHQWVLQNEVSALPAHSLPTHKTHKSRHD